MKIEDFKIIETQKNTKNIKVFKVQSKKDSTYYALKLILKNCNIPYSNYQTTIKHKNIIKCFSISEVIYKNEKYTMYVLEWANDGCLGEIFIKKEEQKKVVLQILKAINYLHKKNIVHSDIKHVNILFTKENGKLIPKISDYGINLPHNFDNYFGTPEYLAPEFRQGLTKQTDIWALGCLLHQLFLGILPFGNRLNGDSIKKIEENALKKPLPKNIINLVEPFKYITFKTLKKEPKERFKNVDEIIKILNNNPTKIKKIKWTLAYMSATLKGEIV